MLREEDIRRALRASRVLPVEVRNPHGPLGLEQLAEAVARRTAAAHARPAEARVRRPIDLPAETWQKLDRLAEETSKATSSPVRPSELAASIIEDYLTSTKG
jgi:hypothetical protein